ncbi:MAG: hypothetical protein FJY97_07045 [candidate division Zixibacteria bacterium]|nr:hypothetical protein [candidate division Zixibacteria bacterium]
MSFFEVETWKPKPDLKVEHDEMVRKWFAFLKTHQKELFPEWKSARYYHEVERYTGQATGRYIMVFEYVSHKGFMAYKERRKDWSGPYAEYKKVDPYVFFDMETVTEHYWMPEEEERWLSF